MFKPAKLFKLKALAYSSIFMLASCGGGGGGGSSAVTATVPANGGETPVETPPQFVNITVESGIDFTHGYQNPTENSMPEAFAGGAAAGDYDNDGDIDLYIVRGDLAPNLLYQNDGRGNFTDLAVSAGVAETKPGGGVYRHSGPTFADMDGDGYLDLLLGSLNGDPVMVYRNNGDGTFSDVTAASGLDKINKVNTISAAFGDYDLDGRIDLALSHWGSSVNAGESSDTQTLWRNISTGSGNIAFSNTSTTSGISSSFATRHPGTGVLAGDHDYSFAPSFARMDGDLYPDLLSVADFRNSQIFLNNGDSTFTDATDEALMIDDSGMGSALGDYDNDGDLDWFVTSILGSNQPTGNRLYQNSGIGSFADISFEQKIHDGGWAWAACFADFNLDGMLDIYHVNGWRDDNFNNFSSTPNRLFINNGATFDEQASDYGLDDSRQGRGLVCADFDNDGDTDVFITHSGGINSGSLYRNDNTSDRFSLTVTLEGRAPNTEASGARIYASIGATTQMREIVIGSNFTSQNPTSQIIGLGDATSVDTLKIEWPDGTEQTFTDVAAGSVAYTQP